MMKLALATMVSITAFAADYVIQEKEISTQNTAAIRFVVKDFNELDAKFAEAYPKIVTYLNAQSLTPTGAPYSRYFRFEPGTAIDVEVGFPVASVIAGEGDVKASALPGGMVATTTHLGPYGGIGGAYEALHKWMDAHHKKPAGGPWEIYVNDPSSVPPEEIRTDIFFPIQ